MLGAPGYSQSKSTPSMPESKTNLATLAAKSFLFAADTDCWKIEYESRSVEKDYTPKERMRLTPFKAINLANWPATGLMSTL